MRTEEPNDDSLAILTRRHNGLLCFVKRTAAAVLFCLLPGFKSVCKEPSLRIHLKQVLVFKAEHHEYSE